MTTSERSLKEQRRDLNIFLQYMETEVGNILRSSWTPRLSAEFIRYMQAELNADTGKRRDLLDAADLLVVSGGLSRNRRLYKNDSIRQKRKGYRAFRNRAIVYSLIKTGMRRTAVVRLNLDDVNFDNRSLKVLEKDGITHSYKTSREGLQAIRDYLERQREGDS